MEEKNFEPIEPMEEKAGEQEALLEQVERKIAEAVALARAQWETQAQSTLEESVRMQGMSEAERAEYALAQREKAIAEREQRIAERELRMVAMEKLAEKGLPTELADALTYTGEACMLASLDRVEGAFRRAVQQSVNERLSGSVPASGKMNREGDSLDDDAYYRMNYAH